MATNGDAVGSRPAASVGASLQLNDWLRIRGGAMREPVASRFSDLFNGANTGANLLSDGATARSLGGDVELNLRPGVQVSGSVSRLQTDTGANPLGASTFGLTPENFSGLRYQGGLGLSGWQNRVVLNAQLSRLVPEDSLALSSTAAELNLGVGLTDQVSLKLLYQQLFDGTQQSHSNRVVAGGMTINF
jgi:hypothetical protein